MTKKHGKKHEQECETQPAEQNGMNTDSEAGKKAADANPHGNSTKNAEQHAAPEQQTGNQEHGNTATGQTAPNAEASKDTKSLQQKDGCFLWKQNAGNCRINICVRRLISITTASV